MEKLKNLKEKHDHLLTKLLKVFLFSCVMIAPIIAGTSQMLYATFNKNAKDSYSGNSIVDIHYKYQTNEVSTSNDLIEGNIYHFEMEDWRNIMVSGATYNIVDAYDLELLEFEYSTINMNQLSSLNYYNFTINRTNNNLYIAQYENGVYKSTVNILAVNIGNNLIFNFVYKSNFNLTYLSYVSICDDIPISSVDYDTSGTLDNAFYYGMDKMANSNMFSWTKNTGIYTGINAMTTGMDINTDNNILAVLLTYWLLMTAIYIVIDIIIELFVKLTHLLS